MDKEPNRYSQEELDEFEQIVREKIKVVRRELDEMKRFLGKKNDSEPTGLPANINLMEGGMEALEKENISQLATRQQKFVKQLEAAMMRIKNKSYGVCVDTGKLISKERLRLVPHTMHSIEAKGGGKKPQKK